MKMTDDEMVTFVNLIGRFELTDELAYTDALYEIGIGDRYPKYLKAVRASVWAMGFDEEWVEHEFRHALEYVYLSWPLSGTEKYVKGTISKLRKLRKQVRDCCSKDQAEMKAQYTGILEGALALKKRRRRR